MCLVGNFKETYLMKDYKVFSKEDFLLTHGNVSEKEYDTTRLLIYLERHNKENTIQRFMFWYGVSPERLYDYLMGSLPKQPTEKQEINYKNAIDKLFDFLEVKPKKPRKLDVSCLKQ